MLGQSRRGATRSATRSATQSVTQPSVTQPSAKQCATPSDPVWLTLAIVAIVVSCVFLLWPVGSMLVASLIDATGAITISGYMRFFSEPIYRQALCNTVILGATVTCFSMLLGGGLAVILARYTFPLAGFASALPLLTMVIPDVIVASAWVLILGRQGIVNGWLSALGLQIPSLYGWWGLIFVMTLNHYAYAFVAVLVGLKSMDRTLEEAASSLGRPMWRVISGVTLPMLLPSILSGAVVVYTHVIGSFGVPAMIGARTPVLAVKAYHEFVSEMGGDAQMQATLASAIVFLGIAALVLQKLLVSPRHYQMAAGHASAPSCIAGWRAVVSTSSVLLLIALSVLPTMVVIVTAFTPSSGPVLHYGGFTLDHLSYVWRAGRKPLSHSVFLATVATIIGTLFSVVAAYLIVKRRSVLSNFLEILLTLPMTIAGTALGIALATTFNSGWLVLTGSWTILALAYFWRRMPISVRAVIGPLHNLKDAIEEASMSLGVSPIRSFFKVVVPLLGPSIAAAAVWMWVTTLSELSATMMLYFGGMTTIPVEIFQQVDSGRLGVACAYSLLLLLTIFVPLAVQRRAIRQASSRNRSFRM